MSHSHETSGSRRADILVEEAYAMRRGGEPVASLNLYQQAEKAFGSDASGRAHCLRHIGDLAHELGRIDEARAALHSAEHLYRNDVADSLSLANTIRLLAIIDGDVSRWRQARKIYGLAAAETGLDLKSAFEECDRRLAIN